MKIKGLELETHEIKRDVIVMQAPQGSYYYEEEIWKPQFPLYIGMCEPITREEEVYGNVIVFPIDGGGYNHGHECVAPRGIMNEVSLYYLRKFIADYAYENECDNLKEAVEEIMDMFEIHKTPIPLSVRKYVDDVMNGVITEIPTRV